MTRLRSDWAAASLPVRLLAVVLVGGMLACTAFQVEAWPATSWRLFSQLRTRRQAGWQITIVDRGAERPFPLARLGRGFRGDTRLLERFPTMTAARRRAICQTWRTAAGRALGRPELGLRVYRTVRLLPMRDRRVRPVSRRLRYHCEPAP